MKFKLKLVEIRHGIHKKCCTIFAAAQQVTFPHCLWSLPLASRTYVLQMFKNICLCMHRYISNTPPFAGLSEANNSCQYQNSFTCGCLSLSSQTLWGKTNWEVDQKWENQGWGRTNVCVKAQLRKMRSAGMPLISHRWQHDLETGRRMFPNQDLKYGKVLSQLRDRQTTRTVFNYFGPVIHSFPLVAHQLKVKRGSSPNGNSISISDISRLKGFYPTPTPSDVYRTVAITTYCKSLWLLLIH